MAVALVAAVLVFAIVRPRGLPEIVAAAPAAALVLLLGLVDGDRALDEILALAPTVGFLAAVLAVGHLADALGVFRWTASVLQRGSRGSPIRLLALVFVAAATVTAVLSLDATVVLLTPVVVRAARSLGVHARPHSYATAHLANSASTLLPVSNLTNLMAFSATGLSFVHFTTLTAGPWLAAIVVEFVVFRMFFRRDLAPRENAASPEQSVAVRSSASVATPRLALGVLACTLAGFAVSGFVGVDPAWVALAAALLLGGVALRRGTTTPRKILYAIDVWFCGFVLLLGVVVAPVADGPVGTWLAMLLPSGTSFVELLWVATLAALAANLLNNLPATLLLLAALGPGAPTGLVLAMVLGVNLGPNLTYVGSLAVMLWRRVTARAREPASLRTFTALGLATTPAALVAAVGALWLVV
nr:SLC13 family permease [Rhodococcus sp. HNM0569]